MDELLEILEKIYVHPKNEISFWRGVKISREFLHQMYNQNSETKRQLLSNIQINIEDSLIDKLSIIMRKFLKNFIDIDSDRIGTANNFSNIINPNVQMFSHFVADATILIGPHKVAKFLNDWKTGEPLYFQQKVHLSGLKVNAPIKISDDIRICSPQDPASEITQSFMYESYNFKNKLERESDYGSILTIDWEEKPCFFKPNPSDLGASCSSQSIELRRQKKSNLSVEKICNSLAICTNCYVKPMCLWNEYGDIFAFKKGIYSFNVKNFPNTNTHKKITENDLPKLNSIIETISLVEDIVPRYEIASHRWIQSLLSEALIADKFIDLRIASEAIYLSDTEIRGEMKFRLANRAAWLHGKNSDERIEIYNLFSKFYSKASKMVHASSSNDKKIKSEEKEMLEKIQKYIGIALQIPYNFSDKCWQKLIMGDKEFHNKISNLVPKHISVGARD